MERLTTDSTSLFRLKVGHNWSSFDKFRNEGKKGLESVKDGTIGTLHTKTGQYRILEEHDFQKLYGLARDVQRWRGGMRMVVQAVRVVQKHPEPETINLLINATMALGYLPELPTRDSFDSLPPEGADVDPDDEVTLDPAQIERPLSELRC